MKSIRMILLLCIVLLAGTLVSGCVYYNTFYNARKQFQEAERKREEAENVAATSQKNRQRVFRYRDFYWRAIRKASIVLDRHPGKRLGGRQPAADWKGLLLAPQLS